MKTIPDLGSQERAVLRKLLEHPKYELIPLKNVLEQASHLPAGATVSVTASPAKGMDATIDLAAELSSLGFEVVPHLSARLTRDLSHLERILRRLEDLHIDRVFLVGGDADPPGEFFDAPTMLRAMEQIGHHLGEIGIPCYPEGHPVIPQQLLWEALAVKQPAAAYMTTQMCFDAAAIAEFILAARTAGITLPVQLGLPGVADRLKLMKLSARIGVGQSVRFLTKHRGLLSHLVMPGGYSPEELLLDLSPSLLDERTAIAGLHIYTFNQVETTERWRHGLLAEL